MLAAMRIVFMGTPEFAVPTLRRLIDDGHDIAGVFTQPDRPVGRGQTLAQSPVKMLALERGLPVYQPASISAPDVVERLRTLAPDAGVIAAYGQILRQSVLDVPPLGVLNVHASLLPRWRGASPVTAAILAGDVRTGVTIMQVRRALDAGPMLGRVERRIQPDDTGGALTKRLAEAGASLLAELLPKVASGEIVPEEQDDALATYAGTVEKQDALIDWTRDDAETVSRKVRAYNPWPVAYSYLDGQPLRILECRALQHRSDKAPGTIFSLTEADADPLPGAGFGVATAGGDIAAIRIQGPGGRAMLAAEYLRGHRTMLGKRLTATPE